MGINGKNERIRSNDHDESGCCHVWLLRRVWHPRSWTSCPLSRSSSGQSPASLLYNISTFIFAYIYIYTYWYIVLQHIYLYRCVLYNNILIISIYIHGMRGVILFCCLFRDHSLCFPNSLSTYRYTYCHDLVLETAHQELERAQQLEDDFCLDQLRN